MLGEKTLASVDVETDETPAGVGELDIAIRQIGEAEELERFGNRKQLVGLHLKCSRDLRQIGFALIGRRGQGLQQA